MECPCHHPQHRKCRVLDNCLELCIVHFNSPWGGQPGPCTSSGEASVDLKEIDQLPWMHTVADPSNEKESVHLSCQGNIISHFALAKQQVSQLAIEDSCLELLTHTPSCTKDQRSKRSMFNLLNTISIFPFLFLLMTPIE